MRKLNVQIIDLISKASDSSLFARLMNANFASIMPQVIAIWCEQEGHNVKFVPFTGIEKLEIEASDGIDIVFISAFTQAALKAYALSNKFRASGAVTVLGGPHARCYPEDSQKYFDYVLGFTNKELVKDVLQDCSPHRPAGQYLSAAQQPIDLPGVRERWKYIELLLKKAPWLKIVSMIGSMGCPYSCNFCIDATVPYRPMDDEVIKEDLRFLRTKFKRPAVAWHDPNFGIRFNETMGAIEEAIPPDSIDFIAESSLSLLSEEHVIRLRKNGFKALLPGIESWYEAGNKARTGKKQGLEKVEQVAEHVNMIMRHIPYMQTNFIYGLDSDEGSHSFDMTKEFLDKAPGAFPAFSILTAFGKAAPLNLEYQKENRVLPVPFPFLNDFEAMNIKPKNYGFPQFYDYLIDLVGYGFSKRAIYKRFCANKDVIPKWMNVMRGISLEGRSRWKYHKGVRRRFDEDHSFREYMEGETQVLPKFFKDKIVSELGKDWHWLPEGAIYHDPNAALKSKQNLLDRQLT